MQEPFARLSGAARPLDVCVLGVELGERPLREATVTQVLLWLLAASNLPPSLLVLQQEWERDFEMTKS